jgi:hypothetical protein
MKTLAIIITLFTTVLISSGNVEANNNTTKTNTSAVREQVVKKVGMPELSREKIAPASVSVTFTISENNLIIVKEVSGENSFLNEYVGTKLHHSKIGITPETAGQEFEITFNFGKQ